MGKPRAPPSKVQKANMAKSAKEAKPSDSRPPFRSFVRVEYNDAELYRPVDAPDSTAGNRAAGASASQASAGRAAPSRRPPLRQQPQQLRGVVKRRVSNAIRRRLPAGNAAIAAAAVQTLDAVGRTPNSQRLVRGAGAAAQAAASSASRQVRPGRVLPTGPVAVGGTTATSVVVAASAVKKSALKRRSARQNPAGGSGEPSDGAPAQNKSAKSVRFARGNSGGRPSNDTPSGRSGSRATASVRFAGPSTPVATEVIDAAPPPAAEEGPEGTASPQTGKRNSQNAGSTPWNGRKSQRGSRKKTVVHEQQQEEQQQPSDVGSDEAGPLAAETVADEPGPSRKSTRASRRVSQMPSLPVLPESGRPVDQEMAAVAQGGRASNRRSRKSVLPTAPELKSMHDAEIVRLTELRSYWAVKKAEVESWPEGGEESADGKVTKDDLLWRINAAEFCAKKVMEKGLQMFRKLYDTHVLENDPEKPVHLEDLKGMWDRVFPTVESAVKSFDELSTLENNGWVPPVKTRQSMGRRSVGVAGKSKVRRSGARGKRGVNKPKIGTGTAAASRANLRQMMMAARAKLANDHEGAAGANAEEIPVIIAAPTVSGASTASGSAAKSSRKSARPRSVKADSVASVGSARKSVKKRGSAGPVEEGADGVEQTAEGGEPVVKRKRTTVGRRTRGKSSAGQADVAAPGLFEVPIDDVEPEHATTIGGALNPEVVSPRNAAAGGADTDDDEGENEEPLHEIIPSPSSIGFHAPTSGEKAFDALLSKPSFDHGQGAKSAKSVVSEKGKKAALKAINRATTVGAGAADVTPVVPRATRSARK